MATQLVRCKDLVGLLREGIKDLRDEIEQEQEFPSRYEVDLGAIRELCDEAAASIDDFERSANGENWVRLQTRYVELAEKAGELRKRDVASGGPLRQLPIPPYDLLLPFKAAGTCRMMAGDIHTTESTAEEHVGREAEAESGQKIAVAAGRPTDQEER